MVAGKGEILAVTWAAKSEFAKGKSYEVVRLVALLHARAAVWKGKKSDNFSGFL